jgi:hypothetical protein
MIQAFIISDSLNIILKRDFFLPRPGQFHFQNVSKFLNHVKKIKIPDTKGLLYDKLKLKQLNKTLRISALR